MNAPGVTESGWAPTSRKPEKPFQVRARRRVLRRSVSGFERARHPGSRRFEPCDQIGFHLCGFFGQRGGQIVFFTQIVHNVEELDRIIVVVMDQFVIAFSRRAAQPVLSMESVVRVVEVNSVPFE